MPPPAPFFLAVFVTEAKLRNPGKAEIPPLLLSQGAKGRRNAEENAKLWFLALTTVGERFNFPQHPTQEKGGKGACAP